VGAFASVGTGSVDPSVGTGLLIEVSAVGAASGVPVGSLDDSVVAVVFALVGLVEANETSGVSVGLAEVSVGSVVISVVGLVVTPPASTVPLATAVSEGVAVPNEPMEASGVGVGDPMTGIVVSVAGDGEWFPPWVTFAPEGLGVEVIDGLIDAIVGVAVVLVTGGATLIGADIRIGVAVGVGVGVSTTKLNNRSELSGADILRSEAELVPVGVGVAVGVSVGAVTAVLVGVDVLVAVGVSVSIGVAVEVAVLVAVTVLVGVGVSVSRGAESIIAAPSGGPPPKGIETLTESLSELAFDEFTVTWFSSSPDTQLGGNGLRTRAEPIATAAPSSTRLCGDAPTGPVGLLIHWKQAPRSSTSETL
jgi:hypothetical protein